MELEFSRQILKKYKIHPIAANLFYAERRADKRTDRQTDMTKLIDAFRNFAKAPNKTKRFSVKQNCTFKILEISDMYTFRFIIRPSTGSVQEFIFFLFGATAPSGPGPPNSRGF
jgi:hypothetical protein